MRGHGALTPRDLAAARVELLRLADGPLAGAAGDAWTEAEEALADAERAGETPRADDAAYVALRKAELARLAALHAGARLALSHARAEVRRLGEDGERREAFFADLARRRRADAEALALASLGRRRALDAVQAGDPSSLIVERPGGPPLPHGGGGSLPAGHLAPPRRGRATPRRPRRGAPPPPRLRRPRPDPRRCRGPARRPRAPLRPPDAPGPRHPGGPRRARERLPPRLRRSPHETQVDVLAIERPR